MCHFVQNILDSHPGDVTSAIQQCVSHRNETSNIPFTLLSQALGWKNHLSSAIKQFHLKK